MQFGCVGEVRLSICEDYFEFARFDDGARRKTPLSEVGVIGRKRKTCDYHVRSGEIKEFNPGDSLPGGVGDAALILSLEFINAKRREGRQLLG